MRRTVLPDSPHSKITARLSLPTHQRRQEQTFPHSSGRLRILAPASLKLTARKYRRPAGMLEVLRILDEEMLIGTLRRLQRLAHRAQNLRWHAVARWPRGAATVDAILAP